LLRTADAANLMRCIVANPKSDLYSPNIVTFDVGLLLQINYWYKQIINFSRRTKINFLLPTLQNSTSYHTQGLYNSTALVVGTEATGLTQEWRDAATQRHYYSYARRNR
jgi:TrmH family RNA methyltransferase